MAFSRSPFGGQNTTVVKDVHNHYGPWTEFGADGVVKTEGSTNELKIEVTGVDLNQTTTFNKWLVQPTLPKGAVITSATVLIKEVFSLTGTTPTIAIGTSSSETTNGVSISKAQAEALGTYNLTLAGTWASPLTAATTVNFTMGGTSPVSGTGGRAIVLISYRIVT